MSDGNTLTTTEFDLMRPALEALLGDWQQRTAPRLTMQCEPVVPPGTRKPATVDLG